MLTHYPNAFMNPHFELQDYGTASVNSTNYVVTRVKLERTGTAAAVTAQPGTTDSSVTLEKWLRSRACIDMVVTAASYNPGSDTAVLRQRVPNLDRSGKQTACLRVVAFGPDGGSFEIGLSGGINQRRSRVLTTQGNTGAGTPIWTCCELREDIAELSTTYLTAELFSKPADMNATYKIAYAHMEFLVPGQQPTPFRYSPAWHERTRCARYLWPCPRNQLAFAASTTQLMLPVVTPVEMEAAPSLVKLAGSIDWKQGSNATIVNTTGATSTGTVTNTRGGRVVLGGFTGLPSSMSPGMIDTDNAFLLEAEL